MDFFLVQQAEKTPGKFESSKATNESGQFIRESLQLWAQDLSAVQLRWQILGGVVIRHGFINSPSFGTFLG